MMQSRLLFILLSLSFFWRGLDDSIAQSTPLKSGGFREMAPSDSLPVVSQEAKDKGEASTLNDRFTVKIIPKITLGPPDEKDPFGVDFSGPLEKAPTHVTADTEIPKITLQMVVNQLTIQAIFDDTKEALINSFLLNEGDKFNVEWGAGTFTLILKKIETERLFFAWTNDDKTATYIVQSQGDIFASDESDPMKELNQPTLIDINLNTPTAKTDKIKSR